MGQSRAMYYSDGSKCLSKANFEDNELNSMEWVHTTLFETAEECCREKFWWDVGACIQGSPKEIIFTFSIDVNGVSEPTNCQDADRIAQAMQAAANFGWDDEYTHAFMTSIGNAELSTNTLEGTTECGGSLAGQTYAGSYDPSAKVVYDISNKVTMTFEVSAKSVSCSDDPCFQDLYNLLKNNFSLFVGYGLFTTEIAAKAIEMGVPYLLIALPDALSLTFGTFKTAEVIAAESHSGLYYPNWESTKITNDIHVHTW